MYSVNVPIPGELGALARRLATDLGAARVRPRGEHTLVAKRLDQHSHRADTARAREALAGTRTFDVRVESIGTFDAPPEGPAPVVYFDVESPGLLRVHDRLVDAFDAVPGLEGDDYTPHVTIGRGCTRQRARALQEREFEPIEWTVSQLQFWDARHKRSTGSVSLPA